MKYKVVVRMSIKLLERDVNELIGQGWIPFGSLAVDNEESRVSYLQPIIKHSVSTVSTYKGKPIEENIFTTTGIKDNEFDSGNPPATP